MKAVSNVSNPIVERNEAYACTVVPKVNPAYEKGVLKMPGHLSPEKDIALKINNAYESTIKETVIYEEIFT